jgi:Tfp pilus assembly protein PilN
MKEIDFLPEWYKSGRRRQLSYQSQYLALAGIFVVMIVWNIFATRSISKARAESADLAVEQAQAESVSVQLVDLKKRIRVHQNKRKSIENMDSKINVASVLAEISFLVDEKIILKKVEFKPEKFPEYVKSKSSSKSNSVVQVVSSKSGQKQDVPIGNVRFRVVISGIAADARNVAALICKLEDSTYFDDIVLAFSRNGQIEKSGIISIPANRNIIGNRSSMTGDGNPDEKLQISEFEINCYLANYKKQ